MPTPSNRTDEYSIQVGIDRNHLPILAMKVNATGKQTILFPFHTRYRRYTCFGQSQWSFLVIRNGHLSYHEPIANQSLHAVGGALNGV